MSSAIFKDLLVVELAGVLAGPAVGMFFAELGARVLKIENKKSGGDVTRTWKLPGEDPEDPFSAYYHSVNWGKEVHLLDLNEAADRAQVFEWIARADVLISNFRPSVARKLGMDGAVLREHFPRLIIAQITGYGPDADRPAFDMVLQAESGFMFMTGEPGRLPVRLPVALIDILAAHHLKEGILVALLQRERNGLGAEVQVSLRDAAVASLGNQATNWLVAGHIPQRLGSRHPNIAPYGDIFSTSDGQWLVLAVGSDAQFVALCRALGQEHLLTTEHFLRNAGRVIHREALHEQLSHAIGKIPWSQLEALLHEQEVPFGLIRDMQQVFSDPAVVRLILEPDEQGHLPGRSVRTAIFELR